MDASSDADGGIGLNNLICMTSNIATLHGHAS